MFARSWYLHQIFNLVAYIQWQLKDNSTELEDLEDSVIQRKMSGMFVLLILAMSVSACSENIVEPEGEEVTSLLQIIPEGGAINVDPNAPITIAFSHTMGPEMEMYIALHEGSTGSPIIEGTWTWSEDRMTVTCQPNSPLEPGTEYSVHLGGGMTDLDGNHINYEEHGMNMGGNWVTEQMLGDFGTGMMGGTGSMMGPGWQHHNGTYGMVFTFTTASAI